MSQLWIIGEELAVLRYQELSAKVIGCPRMATPLGQGIHAPAEISTALLYDALVEHPAIAGTFRHRALLEDHPLINLSLLDSGEQEEWLAANAAAAPLDPSWGL